MLRRVRILLRDPRNIQWKELLVIGSLQSPRLAGCLVAGSICRLTCTRRQSVRRLGTQELAECGVTGEPAPTQAEALEADAVHPLATPAPECARADAFAQAGLDDLADRAEAVL